LKHLKNAKEDNARINKVSAIGSGLAKIVENVQISIHFETAPTDTQRAQNACCIDYTDTWSSKPIYSL
jgi:hypothetical protein